LELTFAEGLEFVYDPEKLLKVDYVILDVRLEIEEFADEHNEQLSNILKYYEKEEAPRAALKIVAGYQLYIELIINLGFPKDHILLCSNHANDLLSLADAFDKAKMRLPKIPTKEEKDKTYVRQWVRERRENPYSVLRRGILNVLDEIEGNANIDLTEPFKKEVPVNKDSFLEGLRFMLSSPREPSKDKRQHLYRTLCDYLTKYFDRFSRWDLYKGKYKNNGAEISVSQEYFIPPYFIINWVAHNILNNANSEFDAQDVGFLFTLVIKAMFDYPIIQNFKLLYTDSTVNETDLQTCLIELQNRHYNYSGQCEIFELIRLKGEKNWNRNLSTEDFVAHLYASFLFCCVELKTRSKARTFSDRATQHQGLGYWVNLTYLINSQGDRLFESLKSIAYHRLKERKKISDLNR
jgi:hypothetical protein